MENKEYLTIIDGDMQHKYPVIFNEDEFIAKINSEEKHYNYSDVDNIKMPALAIIKNVNFMVRDPKTGIFSKFTIEFKKAEVEERQNLYAFLNRKLSEDKNKELVFKCNTCGNIFAYTKQEKEDNDRRMGEVALHEGISMLNAVAGTQYNMYEQQKQADAISSKIIDFSKCPKCNSKDIVKINSNQVNNKTKEDNSDKYEELKKLKELLDMDIITQEEFEKKKKELLNL